MMKRGLQEHLVHFLRMQHRASMRVAEENRVQAQREALLAGQNRKRPLVALGTEAAFKRVRAEQGPHRGLVRERLPRSVSSSHVLTAQVKEALRGMTEDAGREPYKLVQVTSCDPSPRRRDFSEGLVHDATATHGCFCVVH